ncbi:MAG: immune inhibitor A, partial [Candidatus Cloacimonadaceae bacterium]|nr:immune inhibitor A [Candidatus Cloacimonadaceae bacterium]
WNNTFRVTVQKAGISYESFCLNDLAGNNNGFADPNESFLLVVNFRNPSQVAVLDLIGQLSSVNANINISNTVQTMAVLEGNTVSQFVFEASLSASTPPNSTIPLTFSLSSANTSPVYAQLGLGCGEMGMHSNFENDNGGFTPLNGWSWGTPSQIPAHSGSKLWATALTGQYANGANYKLTTPLISIGTGADLSFWHQLNCQSNFDGGNVSVSINGGASWIVISPSSGGTYANTIYSMNEPGFTGNIGAWTLVTFDLSPFANSEILIRWHFTSDGSISGYGWFIDDVMVSGFAVRSGVISGEVTLSDGGDPSAATVAAPFEDTMLVTRPDSGGTYSIYLPDGSYSLTASLPYHVSAVSPVFIISDSSLDYVHDFMLTDLPSVSGFSLYHVEDEPLVSLNWTAPANPIYPVLEYKVYRKTGPGLSVVIATLTDTVFSESLYLDGHYYYFVRPVYAPGEGAPSDTLDLEISTTVAIETPPLPKVNALHPNYPNPF